MLGRNQSLEGCVPGCWSGLFAWTATGLLAIALTISYSPQAFAYKKGEPARPDNPPAAAKREPVDSAQPATAPTDDAKQPAAAARLIDAMAESVASFGLGLANKPTPTTGRPENQARIPEQRGVPEASSNKQDDLQPRAAIFVMQGGDPAKSFVDLLESRNVCKCTLVAADEIRSGALASFDVVLIPGGRASKQFDNLGEEGRKALRQFVEEGGGYVGVCAGGYLASYLDLVSVKTLGKNPIPGPDTPTSVDVRPAGAGIVKMELTGSGRKVLGDLPGPVHTLFSGGPIFYRAKQSNLPECVCLAHYRSDISFNDFPSGTMKDTPAILAAQFGKGRIIIFSPHPECVREGVTAGVESLVIRAVLATARKPVEKETKTRENAGQKRE